MRNSFNRSFALSAAILRSADDAAASAPKPETETSPKPETAKPAKRKQLAEKLAAKRKAEKPAAKPGKRAAAKPTTPAAKPDPKTAKAERVAAERSSIAAFYGALNGAVSIPVKTLSAFKPMPSHAHVTARGVSARQAAAICAAFAGAGKKLATGTAVPRVFEHNGARVCIENGVIADAISSGLISVAGDSPETEKLTLRAKPAVIIGLIGEKAIKAAKLA